MIVKNGTNYKAYKGGYKPCQLYLGDKKIAGWHDQTQTGSTLTFSGTYNDVFSALNVACKTTETGTGTKSPDNLYTITGTTKLTVSDGTTPHDYVLPQTGYSLPNGISDIFNAIMGLFTQNVGKVILSGGTEYYAVTLTNTNTVCFRHTLGDGKTLLPDEINIIMDRFKTRLSAGYASDDTEWCAHNPNGAALILINILKSRLTGWSDSWTDTQKVAAFKTWLAANPVTVIYQLATPQTIQGTPQAIPTYPNQTILSSSGTITANAKIQN